MTITISKAGKKFWGIVLIVMIIDQVSKYFFLSSSLTVANKNFSFGLPINNSVSIIITAFILAVVFFYFSKQKNILSLYQKISFGFIIGGAISNLLERIIRGHVTDFIYFLGGIMNLADIFIFAGIIILLSTMINSKGKMQSAKF